MVTVRVQRPGALTTVQDAGRPGLAHLGVPRSGALDPAAHRLANRLVGNPQAAPVLETTLNGVTLSFSGPAAVAVTGAVAPVRLDGRPAGRGVPVLAGAGQVLDVGRASAGVRCYVAVSGGFAVPPVLGSASADLLSGLGPARLTAGQILAVGVAAGPPAAVDLAPYPVPSDRITLPIRLGPRDGWLTPAGRATLTEAAFSVAQESNRIGLRLRGAPVEQAGRGEQAGAGRGEQAGAGRGEQAGAGRGEQAGAGRGEQAGAGRGEQAGAGRGEQAGAGRGEQAGAGRGELPSEGLVWGAVQLLPDGNLVIFLADHPTTGGYPVIAVVHPAGFSACAQAAPGATVRFRVSGG